MARERISAEILDVHQTSYGAGASRAVVHLLDDLVVVMIEDLELTANEKTLIDGGVDEGVVLAVRSEFQNVIEPSLQGLFSVEFFRLHPAAAA